MGRAVTKKIGAKTAGASVRAGGPKLTERQEKWFATVRANFEAKTGKSLDDWKAVMKTCPETRPRAQAAWLKERHGVGVNHAATILSSLNEQTMWDDPHALLDALWKDPEQRRIYDALAKAAGAIDGAIVGPRKTFVSFARNFQFAAARPSRDGVRLGLAVPPAADPRLAAPKKGEGWSERLKSVIVLTKASEIDARLRSLLKAAFDAS